MQPQHVIAALKELEFAELAEEIEAHQREWDAGERPKGACPGLPSPAPAVSRQSMTRPMAACSTRCCTARSTGCDVCR